MDHIFPCTPQGGNISQLYPTYYSTRVYIGGIYILLVPIYNSANGESTIIATKKQKSMSNYRFIIVSSRAPVSLCSEQSQNDCRLYPYLIPFRSCMLSEM